MAILQPAQYAEFDAFVAAHPNGYFTQTSAWAQVKTEWGHRIVALRAKNGGIAGGALVLFRKIGPFTLLYAPRGPVCDYTDKALLCAVLAEIKALARELRAYEIKMDPFIIEGDPGYEQKIAAFEEAGCLFTREAPFFSTIQPRHNYMLRGLRGRGPDDMMKAFGRDTRYDIRSTQRMGVVCENVGPEGLALFYDLYLETGRRQHFSVRPRAYFERMFAAFGANCRLYLCSYENRPLCGGIALRCGGTVSHVYGASSSDMRRLHPSYLLQWALINWALEEQCAVYDMQGIALRPEDSEELYNVYRFKQNFAGEVITTAGEFTAVYRPLARGMAQAALSLRTKLKKHR